MRQPQRASSLFCPSRTPAPAPSLRRPAAPLNAAREPFPTFVQRAILPPGDEGERQAFRFEPARGAARRASEDQLAKVVVENEDVVCDFYALSWGKASTSRLARVFEGHSAASKGNGQPLNLHTLVRGYVSNRAVQQNTPIKWTDELELIRAITQLLDFKGTCHSFFACRVRRFEEFRARLP